MKTQFNLDSYIHGCTNEHTFSSKSIRFNPYFGNNNYKQHKLAKVGIKEVIINQIFMIICDWICKRGLIRAIINI